MANRRMFSKAIIDTDDFLEMPNSSRLLYYDLGMRSDDYGFVNPKRVMRITGASDDDLKILLAKKKVIIFEDGVIVIRDWKVNNLIRPDRCVPTIYQEHLKKLALSESKQYQLKSGLPSGMTTGMTSCTPSIGENSIEKDSIGEDKKTSFSKKEQMPESEEIVPVWKQKKGWTPPNNEEQTV